MLVKLAASYQQPGNEKWKLSKLSLWVVVSVAGWLLATEQTK